MDDFDDFLNAVGSPPANVGTSLSESIISQSCSRFKSESTRISFDILNDDNSKSIPTSPAISPTDDLDFLMSTISPPATLEQTSSSVGSSALDEFSDMLSASPILKIFSPLDLKNIESEISTPITAANDFLSWLDESPPKPLAELSTTTTRTANILGSLTSPVSTSKPPVVLNLTPLSNSTKPTGASRSSAAVNNFFDEVFGSADDIEGPHISAPAGAEAVPDGPPADLEAEVNDTVQSSFPDIARLRKVLLCSGRVPGSLRGKVWCLLLNGFYKEDQEALDFRADIDGGSISIPSMRADCDAVVASCASPCPVLGSDLLDLLALYCCRKQTEYHQILSQILAPMLVCDHRFGRGLAYSCFYALCSKFIPLVNLQHEAFNKALAKLGDWLRLLVVYHAPLLALHLDRVLPGWEAAADPLSSAQSRRLSVQLAGLREMDDLEQLADMQLGAPGAGRPEISGQVIESARPARGSSTAPGHSASPGCIPLHWTCGLFCGSMPADVTLTVMDWALLNQDRFAGLYLTAALLTVLRDTLLGMSGAEIRLWLQRAAAGTGDWYAIPGASSSPAGWPSFVRGWMYAAEALKQSTPASFTAAIACTEQWASQDPPSSSSSSSSVPETAENDLDEEAHTGHIVGQSLPADGETAEDAATLGVGGKMSRLVEIHTQGMEAARQRFAQMKELAKEQAKYWVNAGGEGGLSVFGPERTPLHIKVPSASGPLPGESEWLQDNLTRSVCLWTAPDEVLPCLCSNRRKPCVSPEHSVVAYYRYGSDWQTSPTSLDPEVAYPVTGHPASRSVKSIEPPFFFGIDCRSEEEKAMGRFPKAFDMNADFIVDSEEVSNLLETLQPLANTVHVCLIGAGEQSVRQRARQEQAARRRKLWDWELDEKDSERSRQREEEEVERAVEEDLAKLNGAAMFFIKRGFSKVSVLSGGFMAAAKYLLRPDCSLSMETALVDVDERVIYKTLSPVSKEKMTFAYPSVFVDQVKEGTGNIVGSLLATIGSKMQKPAPAAAAAEKASVSAGVLQKLSQFGSSMLSKKPASDAVSSSAFADSVAFVIDGEEDEDGDEGPSSSHGVAVTKSSMEKKQALAMHRLAGIVRGEKIWISKESLPGAVLFPAFVFKEVGGATVRPEVIPAGIERKADHRYLVITRERFIVLDSAGEGVGSQAVVKANNHLTELVKMTFRKKDPDLVSLFFVHAADAPVPDEAKETLPAGQQTVTLKAKVFRVAKKKEFIDTLQKSMQRFK